MFTRENPANKKNQFKIETSMKKMMILCLSLFSLMVQAQTARKFTIDLTEDGKAQMVCFLPVTPSGKAIVGVPGGHRVFPTS